MYQSSGSPPYMIAGIDPYKACDPDSRKISYRQATRTMLPTMRVKSSYSRLERHSALVIGTLRMITVIAIIHNPYINKISRN